MRMCPFFKAFLVTVDVPEIYMQELWATAMVHHHAIRFKMDNKKHIVNLESFRDMLHICPRLPGQSFAEPPFEEEILAFIRFLRHIALIRKLTDVNINKLYQPWRFFAAIINKCLIGKSSGYDSLRLSQAQILWGLYHKRNVDYVYLMWEDFVYQPKASVRKTRSSFETTITPPTTVAGPRLTTSEKGKQAAKAFKAKSLSALSEVAMTEAQQLKLVTKRSLQQTHISQVSGFGTDEGTGSIPRVPDVPTDESEEVLSWNSTDEEGDDNEGKDGDGDKDDDGDDGEEGDGDDDDEDDDGEEGMESIFETTSQMDAQTPTSVAPLPILRTLEANFSEVMQMNQFAGAHLEEAQKENDEFLKTIDENMPKIIKEQVKEQVKVQVSKILPRIEQTVNEQLEAEVLTRSLNSSKTSYDVVADLSEMEFKKILVEKMEGNKSIQRSNEQRNLYKALVEAYESNKIILDTYGDTVTLKRRREYDANKDEEPSAGPD
nr:hypothetical protein [Tanacetum cinerariifolium]